MPWAPACFLMNAKLVSLGLLLAGCTSVPQQPPAKVAQPEPPAPPRAIWAEQAWPDLAPWQASELRPGLQALGQSCKAMARKPAWREICSQWPRLVDADPAAVRQWLAQHFRLFQMRTSDGTSSGLVTGYYEPLLQGDRQAGKLARYPLYAVPNDLLTIELGDVYPELKGMRLRGRLNGRKVQPYPARAQIEAGQAEGLAGKELAWVTDAVELFFLQIQGSGRIQLPDGSHLRVGYADQNGHPYKAIGKVLVEQGMLAPGQVSMQSIQAWARANPDKLQAVLDSNPSYVFFRELPASQDGPPGAQGVPLTAEGSIAVDPRHVPLGTPVWLETTYPGSARPLRRLVVAQDTGGAIRGVIRADFFWGFGPEAGRQAGAMKQAGGMWVLWPREIPLPAEHSQG